MSSRFAAVSTCASFIAISSAPSAVSAAGALSLSELQSILRTGLDDELNEIANGASRPKAGSEANKEEDEEHVLLNQRSICDDDSSADNDICGRNKSNVRRKKRKAVNHDTSSAYSSEQIWFHLLHHTWNIAKDMHDPYTFLVCSQDKEDDIINYLSEAELESLYGIESDSPDYECSIMLTTAHRVRSITRVSTTSIQPIVDVMKVQPGVFDLVSSEDWSIPHEGSDKEPDEEPLLNGFFPPNNHTYFTQSTNFGNETEAIESHGWERKIHIGLVPGLFTEDLTTIHDWAESIVFSIRDMGEVGWLDGQDMDAEQRLRYMEQSSVVGLSSLSSTFSMTSLMDQDRLMADNKRLEFWENTFEQGMEAKHGCHAMFDTMTLQATQHKNSIDDNGGLVYDSFDLILNPLDVPPSQKYLDSASNSACVASLIAGLSLHPRVISVDVNDVPLTNGWHLMQKLGKVVRG